MVRRWTVGVLACLAAMLLAGCTEKHQAAQTLPTTTKAASSSTAALPVVGPADFPVPAEARQRTPHGVTAFIDYYIALANRQLKSLDSKPLRALSRNCQTCTQLADGYDRAKAARHRYSGGSLSVASHGSAVLTGTGGEMSFVLKQAELTVRDSSGTIIQTQSSPAYSFTGGIKLAWDRRHLTWLVTQWDAERF